jgi:hypothetical protein
MVFLGMVGELVYPQRALDHEPGALQFNYPYVEGTCLLIRHNSTSVPQPVAAGVI